jgi:hypothetical protein
MGARVSQQTTNRSFDELARAVAEGSLSRRRALKLFAGTAIAALIPSRALADDDCVRICHVPFDRETEECDFDNAETRCVSRRERRRHLENHPCDCRGRCRNCLNGGGICPTGGSCQTGFPFGCQNNGRCFCTTTTEGTTFCAQSISCSSAVDCTSSQDCPSGWVCSDTCCALEGSICNPPCGTTLAGAPSSADNQGMSGH